MDHKPDPATSAKNKARELYAAAWGDFCGTFYDDERVQAEANMRLTRQRLYDIYHVEIGENFLANLPGYLNYMHIYSSNTKRFHWD
ncbi:MAG: hypothetical protein V4719_24140 [Planctomycetota bacterium]